MSSSASISPDLTGHFAYLEAEHTAALAAPLSARRARLVVMLIDAFIDRMFAADPTAEDILVYRAQLGERSRALSLIFALAAHRPDGPRLVTEAAEVPLAEYAGLSVEDFMVSLYNNHTVQRVRIALPDGTRHDVHAVLTSAVAELRRLITDLESRPAAPPHRP